MRRRVNEPHEAYRLNIVVVLVLRLTVLGRWDVLALLLIFKRLALQSSTVIIISSSM